MLVFSLNLFYVTASELHYIENVLIALSLRVRDKHGTAAWTDG